MIYDKAFIMTRIAVTGTSCWEWQLSKDRLGYGQVSRYSSGESLAHRLSYRIFKGSVEGLILRHTCDNPPCCNPGHLIAGTQADNLNDAREKGRLHAKQPWKVTPEVAAEIKRRLQGYETQRSIADDLGLAESTITLVKQTMKD